MMFLGRILVTRAPPQTLRRGVRVGGCGCGRTKVAADVMAALGMTTHNGDLTDATWPAHIAEERALLFPKLAAIGRAYFDPSIAQALARLEDDHRVYLALLADGLPLPPWPGAAHSTADHAALEDLLVATYAAPLRLMAKDATLTAEDAKRRTTYGPGAAATVGSMALAPGATTLHDGALAHAAAPHPGRTVGLLTLLGTAAAAWWGGPWWALGALGAGGLAYAAVAPHTTRVPTLPVGDAPPPSGPPTTDNAPDPAVLTLPDLDLLLNGVDAAVARSSADDAASQAALKQQNAEAKAAYKGLTKKLGDLVGAGDAASSWGGLLVDVALGIGNAIKAFSGDPAKEANTPEQRARLARDFAKMIATGYPPPALGFEMWGASQLADETEVIQRAIEGVDFHQDVLGCVRALAVPDRTDPSNLLDYSPVARELGRSIIVAINNKTYQDRTLAMFLEAAKRPGGALYDRYRPLPVANPAKADWPAAYLPRTPWNLLPAELLVAYAGAARFGLTETQARTIVADALDSFAARWGYTYPAWSAAYGPPAGADARTTAIACNRVALQMIDAWMVLAGYAAKHRMYDGARWAAHDYSPVVRTP